MKKVSLRPADVLQYEKDSETKHVQLTDEYLQKYIRSFKERYTKITFLRQEAGQKHNSFEWGYRIYQHVRKADRTGLLKLLYEEKDFQYGVLAKDKLRSVKDLVISLVVPIVQFSMQDGIIDSERGFTAADVCIQLVEEAGSVDETLMQAAASLLALCDLIEEYKTEDQNPLVRRVQEYALFHAHEPMTAAKVAEAVSVSREHLSRVFREETGQTLQAYLRSVRIREAQNLLRFSGMEISEISKYVGFASQSRFNEAFRRETGMTPTAYRNSR